MIEGILNLKENKMNLKDKIAKIETEPTIINVV